MTTRRSELYHHGVKGMRWGVRRAQRKAARAEKKTRPDADSQATKKKLTAKQKKRLGITVAASLLSGVSAGVGVRTLWNEKTGGLDPDTGDWVSIGAGAAAAIISASALSSWTLDD